MKTSLLLRLAALPLLLLVSSLTHAQAPATAPGYWNTETNLITRDYTIVRFYNGQDQLVYEETLPNVCLDLSRRPGRTRRISRQLTAALQQVLRNPATGRANLLAQQLGTNRRVPHAYAAR